VLLNATVNGAVSICCIILLYCPAGYEVCKACSMTASWSGRESGGLDELLRQYWTDAIITHISSSQSLNAIALKGDVH